MNWLKQALTGADNQTIAIGRIIGLIMLAMAVLTPLGEVLSVAFKRLTIDQWGAMLSQWQVYLPIMVASAGGIIAGTAFTEPKPKE